MRIAVTADPGLPVPPRHYGGIERVIELLVHGLVERGHEVTLFAHADSDVNCTLIPYPVPRRGSLAGFVRNVCLVSSRVGFGQFDLIHSFGRLGYIAPWLPLALPKVMSYQRPITPRSVLWGERFAHGTLEFVGCSRQLIGAYASRPNWHVVHNGVSKASYHARTRVSADAPLVFLGRLEEIKGPHLAIEVAKRTGRSLVLAGTVPDEPQHRLYFRERIEPHLNGTSIRYVGPVDDCQKDELLGSATALLMPVQWDEPFGIVMAEALACGTPVIGLKRGSVPEVVQNGVTGFVCGSMDDMVFAVGHIASLDRAACRRNMEELFSEDAVVNGYLQVYEIARRKSLTRRQGRTSLAG